MVALFHSGGPDVLQGWIGAHLFFVLSGFPITTLLLREHQRTGRVSLPEFCLRRAFRILPVHLLVPALTVVGCLPAGTASRTAERRGGGRGPVRRLITGG